jgi:hypothetical protein
MLGTAGAYQPHPKTELQSVVWRGDAEWRGTLTILDVHIHRRAVTIPLDRCTPYRDAPLAIQCLYAPNAGPKGLE